MESKVLNFPRAMILASIVNKYIDADGLGKMVPYEFVSSLVSSLTEREILIISGMAELDISIEPENIVLSIGEFLLKNQIMQLLQAYKGLGFQ